jgi:hypothetical protein
MTYDYEPSPFPPLPYGNMRHVGRHATRNAWIVLLCTCAVDVFAVLYLVQTHLDGYRITFLMLLLLTLHFAPLGLLGYIARAGQLRARRHMIASGTRSARLREAHRKAHATTSPDGTPRSIELAALATCGRSHRNSNT